MRRIILAAGILAMAAPAASAFAQSGSNREDRASDARDRQDQPRETNAQRARRDRQAYHDEQRDRQSGHDWRQYSRYDWNRSEPGQRAYYADRYYRSGTYYQVRTLGPDDRIYRGENGRYYCRRSDGTTGLIVGGLAGGLIGNTVGRGDSRTVATLLGALGGALAGRAIDRDNLRCE